MLVLCRWTLVFGIFVLAMQYAHAYTFASVGRVNGPAIHTTYLFTTNNQTVLVHAHAYVGSWTNGVCIYAGQYDMGLEPLHTGNQVFLDGNKLQSIVGNAYTCVTISYFYKQPVLDTYQLVWDGVGYTNTIPSTSNVTAL